MKKILFDINHPAHVHFFKNAMNELKNKGHEVFVTSTTKDINELLMNEYGIEYINIGHYRSGLATKSIDFIIVAFRFISVVRKIKPDYILSISSARPFGSIFTKAKTYIFTDTEPASEQIALFKPFATKIFTPACFTKDLGKKQVRYNGYHELAHLHSNWFKPNPEVLSEIGLSENDKFFILRFVSWDATHDIGHKGISLENKRKLIDILKNHGKVIITSEKTLDEEFEKYKMSICPTKMHDLMYYATLYVGESGTMASECAVIGTPAVLINPLEMGYFSEHERNRLIHRLRKEDDLVKLAQELIDNNKLDKNVARNLAKEKLADKIDVTQYIVNLIEDINE